MSHAKPKRYFLRQGCTMTNRNAGFIAALVCYAIGLLVIFVVFETRDEVSYPDWISWILVLPFLLSLAAGLKFLIARNWHHFQGWLMGLALTAGLSIAALVYFFHDSCVIC
jgi:hypothetical protein